jgi:hypothetical protein
MLIRCQVGGEQIGDVRLGVPGEARDQGVDIGVRLNLSRADIQLPAPGQPGHLAQIDDLLKEAREGGCAEPLSDAGKTGVLRQLLVSRVAQIPGW